MPTREQLKERHIFDQQYIVIINELIDRLSHPNKPEDINKYKTALFLVSQLYAYQLSGDFQSLKGIWSTLETIDRFLDVLDFIKSTYPQKVSERCGWLS